MKKTFVYQTTEQFKNALGYFGDSVKMKDGIYLIIKVEDTPEAIKKYEDNRKQIDEG